MLYSKKKSLNYFHFYYTLMKFGEKGDDEKPQFERIKT